MICNSTAFSPVDWQEIAMAFVAGIRFDYSAVFLINVVFFVLFFLPCEFVTNKKYQEILRQVMIFVNMVAISGNIIDTSYFSFQNSRSDANCVATMFFSQDTVNLLPQYLVDYWYNVLFFIIMYVALELTFPRFQLLNKTISSKPFFSIPVGVIISIIYVGVGFFLFRGLGQKTTSVVDAMRYTQPKYVSITLNTPFVVLRTMGKSGLAMKEYMPEDEVEKYFTAYHQYSFYESDFTKKNVVIFILEGFSQRSVGALSPDGKGYTPFLDSIIQNGYAFTNAFANGTRSIQSVPAILSSIPQLMDNTIIGSKFAANKVDALPALLGDKGYKTAFFHGAFNGSMGFDKYCRAIGFDSYYGMDEFMEKYPSLENYDSDWGIFDDKFLLYAKDQFDAYDKPFFATIFTISSHHPYVLPTECQDMFHESRPELNALRYADYALRRFFNAAKDSDWFKNTIFVFSADHTAPYSFEPDVTSSYISPIDRYRIPIVFYNPSDSTFKRLDSTVIQQIDIVPSVLHLLQYDKPFVSFGENVFATERNSFAIQYNSGVYTYIDSSSVLYFDGEHPTESLKITKDTAISQAISERQTVRLQAFLQEYSRRMLLNKTSAE